MELAEDVEVEEMGKIEEELRRWRRMKEEQNEEEHVENEEDKNKEEWRCLVS